jgi:hypothetical protein
MDSEDSIRRISSLVPIHDGGDRHAREMSLQDTHVAIVPVRKHFLGANQENRISDFVNATEDGQPVDRDRSFRKVGDALARIINMSSHGITG